MMFQIMCMSIAESPKGGDGPRITTYRAHHVNLAAQTRSENFIRLYLRQNHLPTGSSLPIGKPKTSAFRSCHPQRLKQRTLKVTVQRLALKLPKKITFFAEETACQKNYICKELKSFGTSLVLNTLPSARSSRARFIYGARDSQSQGLAWKEIFFAKGIKFTRRFVFFWFFNTIAHFFTSISAFQVWNRRQKRPMCQSKSSLKPLDWWWWCINDCLRLKEATDQEPYGPVGA